ncbi:hypothetical protein [Haliangium sp.]|uniref:hypothetical protein n=1 Tax=Haliangium sp. TaxID=2663208 RepID=UPI003D127448
MKYRISRLDALAAILAMACVNCAIDDADLPLVATGADSALDEPGENSEEIFVNPDRRVVSTVVDGSPITVASWGEDTDASGQVHIRIYECEAYAQHPVVHCGVDADEVLVGGGAWADYGAGPGALLTASYPESNDLETWVGKSKDHESVNPHTLHVYAIGMRLTGVSRSTLKSHLILKASTSGSGSHPSHTVSLPAGYQVIGGGARVNWSGSGNLLTESYPYNGTTWKVKSKDHLVSSPATITAYVIGVTTGNIPGFGSLRTQVRNASTYAAGYEGTVTKNPTSGWATTCAAGRASWSGAGRMLTKMMPTTTDSIEVSSKDHAFVSSGTTWAYAIEVQKQ